MNLLINLPLLRKILPILLTLLSLSTIGMADTLSEYNKLISPRSEQPKHPKEDPSTWGEKIEMKSTLPYDPIAVVEGEQNFFALVSDAPNGNSYGIYFLDHCNLSAGWIKVENLSITDATAYAIESRLGGFFVTARDHNNNPTLFYSSFVNTNPEFMEMRNTNLLDSLNNLSWRVCTPVDPNSTHGCVLIPDAHDGNYYCFNLGFEFVGVGYNYFSEVGYDNGLKYKFYDTDSFMASLNIPITTNSFFTIRIGLDGSCYIKKL